MNRLTHPRFEHEKIYIVRAAGRWSDEKLRVLRGPVEMPDGYVTRPVPVEVVRLGDDNVHVLCFHLREGRKRQIRYMCSAAHLVVLSLKRVAIGALRLPDDLKPGEWRDLSSIDVEAAFSRPASVPRGRAPSRDSGHPRQSDRHDRPNHLDRPRRPDHPRRPNRPQSDDGPAEFW